MGVMLLASCNFFKKLIPFTGSSAQPAATQQEKSVTNTLALALGGTRSDTDLVTANVDLKLLDFVSEDTDLFSIMVPQGQTTFTDAKQAQIVPKQEGIGYVTAQVDGKEFTTTEITIPPQRLIQILFAEAQGELNAEASLDAEGQVKLTSVSVTGDALGSVIRNRIDLINEQENPGLFLANPDLYALNPSVSYYNEVIEANNGMIYQFSPLTPDDPTHDEYEGAAQRTNVKKSSLIAYDQAVLTAADIFNGSTKDPTDGAFGFYSPTPDQYTLLQDARDTEANELPAGCGTSDLNFPAFAPVQVLLLPGIAPSTVHEGIPSFVFVRMRPEQAPVVVDIP